jgi:hypothetical protein
MVQSSPRPLVVAPAIEFAWRRFRDSAHGGESIRSDWAGFRQPGPSSRGSGACLPAVLHRELLEKLTLRCNAPMSSGNLQAFGLGGRAVRFIGSLA